MALNNSLANRNQASRTDLASYLANTAVKSQINSVIGAKEGQRFVTAIVSAVNVNPALQQCTNKSIVSGALLGESLKLPPSPQLGYYYLVPYNDTKTDTKVAQFQLGYKGYIQLAIRSGQYKKLNVLAIKEGELEAFDPMNEEIKVNLMIDKWDEREESPTIGYYAMFELTNGFKKSIYWSKKQMIAHADKYSQAFSAKETVIKTRYGDKKKVSFEDYETGNYPAQDAWMYSSFWYKNFDGMAYKTMLRQLISKWGIMSVDMRQAFEKDMTFTDESGSVNYAESEGGVFDEPEQIVDEKTGNASIDNTVSDAAEPSDAKSALFS